MEPRLRKVFDEQLELVLAELPQHVHDLINAIPMVVEDYPSDEVLRLTGMRHRSDLCGLYTGIPLTERSVMHSGVPSDVVRIYREGILRSAGNANRDPGLEELRRQIRVTILHEYGHHHGLSEDELRELGYG